jgi:hypothetical protein
MVSEQQPPQNAVTHSMFNSAANFRPKAIRGAVKDVEGFNAKFAVLITNGVGTMACAYVFGLIAFISLPEVLVTAGVVPASDVPHFFKNQGLIILVAWVAQTFLQLVLLSIIIVGQRVQNLSAEARAEKTYRDAEEILNRLDTHTQGGLREVLDAIHALPGSPKDPATAGS